MLEVFMSALPEIRIGEEIFTPREGATEVYTVSGSPQVAFIAIYQKNQECQKPPCPLQFKEVKALPQSVDLKKFIEIFDRYQFYRQLLGGIELAAMVASGYFIGQQNFIGSVGCVGLFILEQMAERYCILQGRKVIRNALFEKANQLIATYRQASIGFSPVDYGL
jgi:hypothetical protein